MVDKTAENKPYKVLVCGSIPAAGVELLAEAAHVDTFENPARQQLKEIIGSYDALLVSSDIQVDADVITAGVRLKVIGRVGVGPDNIDIPGATAQGILVLDAPEGYIVSATEHTMLLMLELARNIPLTRDGLGDKQAKENVPPAEEGPGESQAKEIAFPTAGGPGDGKNRGQENAPSTAEEAGPMPGRQQNNIFPGVELYKKTLGIIGLGSTGSEVARRARAFGMQILVCDHYLSAEQAEKIGVVPADRDQILAGADFIVLHPHEEQAGQCLLGGAELAKIKKGARIICGSAAGLVDKDALYEAIVKGKVAGAALGQFPDEHSDAALGQFPDEHSGAAPGQVPDEHSDAAPGQVAGEHHGACPDCPQIGAHPLWQLDRVIAIPHFGAFSQEAQENVVLQVAEQVIQVLKGKPAHLVINVPVLPPELLAAVKPFFHLMETLGSFYMQVFGGRVKEIEVTYSGEIADYPVNTLTTFLLVEFLRIMLGSRVNFVNARVIARQRGIKVKALTRTNTSGFNNLVTVKVTTPERAFTIAGTIFERNDIRIVQIGNYSTWVIPSRYMLASRHIDRPGVVGLVGTVLANHGIYLTGMQLGRKEVGGEAFMVLQVDKPIPQAVLQELGKLEPIFSIRFVEIK